MEHAISENVYAGTAMSRRAGYMYGAALDRGPQGQVGSGLGQAPSMGEVGLIVPTRTIGTTGELHTIDGVEMEFQMAPGTEAPAEMHFYFPRFRALCMAENATHNLHNLLTLRGALIRDPHVWAGYLTEAIERFCDRTDVVFASHHWPTWGSEEIEEFLSLQRDLYAYLHDQTLRLLNKGSTGTEIAELFTLPPALEAAWHARGYYGSVSHNVKAIYQRYMGWFDGSPARLWPHPPEALAARYVEALGGADRVVALARAAFDEGDYRWAATLLDHAVFADADHASSRELYADTLEQLAYGSENATWRNFFLSGATELRVGPFGAPATTMSPSLMAQLSPDQLFDAVAIRVDGPRAWGLVASIDVRFTDLGEDHRLTLRNGVLVHRQGASDGTADVTITLTKALLLAMLAGLAGPGIEVEGDPAVLPALLGVLDVPVPDFAIVTPDGGVRAPRLRTRVRSAHKLAPHVHRCARQRLHRGHRGRPALLWRDARVPRDVSHAPRGDAHARRAHSGRHHARAVDGRGRRVDARDRGRPRQPGRVARHLDRRPRRRGGAPRRRWCTAPPATERERERQPRGAPPRPRRDPRRARDQGRLSPPRRAASRADPSRVARRGPGRLR